MAHPHAPLIHHRPRPHRPGRSFAVVNGSTFAVHLLLACSAADFMATRVWGETTVGVLALLLQSALLVGTAVRYDRNADDRLAPQEHDREQQERGEYR